MKDSADKSWFNLIRQILGIYSLPSIFYLFDKNSLKRNGKRSLHEKSSLKYINPDSLKVGSEHTVWATVRNSITDNRRAQLKCKLLSGTYTLQGNRAAFNQYTVDATCKLCLAVQKLGSTLWRSAWLIQ